MAKDTKQRLANSLKKLLSLRTLDHITVKEIVEDCGINRQTFYYNFQDVYDLLDWIFQQETAKLRISDPTVPWQESFIRTVEYLRDNEKVVLNAYRSIGRVQLERYLKEALIPVVRLQIQHKSEGLEIPQSDQEFFSVLFVAGFLGIVFNWLDNSMSISMPMTMELFVNLLEGIQDDTLNRIARMRAEHK